MRPNKYLDVALSLAKGKATILGLKFGERVVEPGTYIPRAEAKSAPELSFNLPDQEGDGTYMVVCLDIDAPIPAATFFAPVLHWIQPDLKAESKTGIQGSIVKLKTTGPFIANYIGPAPPPGGPHRYLFLLYAQPTGFDSTKYAPANGKNLGNWPRTRYDLDEFAQRINLGPILAANYFKSD